ncbi:ATP-binding response regulator [Robiginitalea sp.]|uniref:hybrid sensor histidine kinase/response regulator n=1 Tax=Robiginitalea sp. TaxID=1902411 RepID=UPI003C775F7C
MPITSKDLLDHLSDLQLALEDYSFEKMTVEEANSVKESYDHFRNQLETCIWGGPGRVIIPEQQSAQTNQSQHDGAFSAIGHDLRNPLHGIMGFARILAEAPLEEPYKSIAASLSMASESMSETLNELCGFSRLKDTPAHEVSIRFSLAALLSEIRDYAHLKLLDKPVRIHLDMKSGISETLIGNPSDLRRIMLSVIENACRYTQEGEIKIEAQIMNTNTGAELCIAITDTGIGIPEVELPHIFKPYYQGKQPIELASKGAGFGLSIVAQLVARQDGQILVESTEGKGLSLRLTLPCTPVMHREANRATIQNPILESDTLRGMRILLVEHNPLNNKLLHTRLNAMGCKLFSASGVEEAIQLLEAQPLDALLLDLRLHREKDQKVLKAIRSHQNPYIRSFPILGMSADPSGTSEGEWLRTGIDAFLSKPHTAESLYQKIRDLAKKAQPQALAAQTPQGIEGNTVLLDLSYLKTKCQGDSERLTLLIRALRNGMLEFAGRTRISLNRGDFKNISEGAEKLLIALEMIKAQRLIPIVQQIWQASMEDEDDNRIVRAFSAYLEQYQEVAEALERQMDS